MSSNENLEINKDSSLFILNAPKLKFKQPTISPTPFSLNDSFLDDEMDSSTSGNISFDENSLEDIEDIKNGDEIILPF